MILAANSDVDEGVCVMVGEQKRNEGRRRHMARPEYMKTVAILFGFFTFCIALLVFMVLKRL